MGTRRDLCEPSQVWTRARESLLGPRPPRREPALAVTAGGRLGDLAACAERALAPSCPAAPSWAARGLCPHVRAGSGVGRGRPSGHHRQRCRSEERRGPAAWSSPRPLEPYPPRTCAFTPRPSTSARLASLLPAAHVRASGARAASRSLRRRARSVPRAPSRALAFPVARDRSRSRHLPAALATRPRAPRQFSPAPRRGPSPVPGSRQGASRSLDCSLRELGVPTRHPVAQKAARVPHARCPRCLHPDPGPRAPGPRWFWARPGT